VQLINIKYNVDKSTVDSSNASVEKAKQLTDQLKNSSQQLTQQGTRGNQQYATSIESVKVKMAQLRAQIELTSRSDTQRLNKLVSEYRAAKSEVDSFNKSLHAQEKAANTGTNAFMGMFNAIKLIVGAGITRWLVDTTLDMAKLAGNVEAVDRAFKKQVTNSEGLLYKLRKATQGTVQDIDLMQRALKFQNFGGDVQKLPELLEFAAVRAQQTGESVDYLVNSIVNGIGRKSLLILDNLGISATRLKEELGGASAQSKSVGEVTAAVAKIAQEELEKMGGFAVNSATKVDQITVAWQELRIELAKKIESGGLIDFFKDVVDGGKTTIKNFTFDILQFFGAVKKEGIQVEALKQALEDVERIRKGNVGTQQQQVDLIQQEINSRVQLLGKYNDNIQAMIKERDLLFQTDPYNVRYDQLRTQISAYSANRVVIEETIKALIGYRSEIEKVNESEESQILTIKKLREQKDAYEKQREEETSVNDKAELDRLQRLINVLDERIIKISDNIKWQKYWNDISKQSTKIQDELTESLKKQTGDESMDFFEKLVKSWNQKSDTSNIDFSGIEIPVEIAPPSWEGGNEKAARFRLAMKQWFKDNQDDLIGEGIDFTSGLLDMAVSAELASFETRLDNLKNFHDRQNAMAGDNHRYKSELAVRQQRETLKLEREQAQAQKRARKFSIAIDTAAGIAKAWVNPGYPGAIALTAFLAAQGIVQAAIVDKAQPGFKDGVIDLKGPGTTKSDSIQARLSKGESVMTAEETQGSMRTLKMIRGKKLDDKKLARLIAIQRETGGTTIDMAKAEGLLSKIASNTQGSDFIKQGVTLIEVKKEREGMTRIIRNKWING
jgi:hypothetical protein